MKRWYLRVGLPGSCTDIARPVRARAAAQPLPSSHDGCVAIWTRPSVTCGQQAAEQGSLHPVRGRSPWRVVIPRPERLGRPSPPLAGCLLLRRRRRAFTSAGRPELPSNGAGSRRRQDLGRACRRRAPNEVQVHTRHPSPLPPLPSSSSRHTAIPFRNVARLARALEIVRRPRAAAVVDVHDVIDLGRDTPTSRQTDLAPVPVTLQDLEAELPPPRRRIQPIPAHWFCSVATAAVATFRRGSVNALRRSSRRALISSTTDGGLPIRAAHAERSGTLLRTGCDR